MTAAKCCKENPTDDPRRFRSEMENAVRNLIGEYAADPRLRSSEAWNCFFNAVDDILNL